jgi:CBS domain-containing membrane protein
MFAGQGLHYLPVTRADGKLAGILSQSDVLVAMLADRSEEASPTNAKMPA